MVKRLTFALAALVAPGTAYADVEHDTRVWINLNATGSIKDRLLFYAEVQPRFGDDVARLRQLLIRPAIGYRLSDRVSLFQGYAHVVNHVRGPGDTNEERSFQQLLWTIPNGLGLNLQSRTRFEQRWQSNGRDTGLRARQFVRVGIPLSKRKGAPAALVHGELFVALNDTDWGARSGFDQSRLFAGVDVPVIPKIRAEIGYLNQIVDPARGATQMNHAASLSLVWRP